MLHRPEFLDWPSHLFVSGIGKFLRIYPLPLTPFLTFVNILRNRSYIDLLHQMCLFNHSTDLMCHCNDTEIRKLKMRAAEYKESCNYCHKPLNRTESGFCKNCRQRVGLCFVCQQPVNGVYVWCPGCGTYSYFRHKHVDFQTKFS